MTIEFAYILLMLNMVCMLGLMYSIYIHASNNFKIEDSSDNELSSDSEELEEEYVINQAVGKKRKRAQRISPIPFKQGSITPPPFEPIAEITEENEEESVVITNEIPCEDYSVFEPVLFTNKKPEFNVLSVKED